MGRKKRASHSHLVRVPAEEELARYLLKPGPGGKCPLEAYAKEMHIGKYSNRSDPKPGYLQRLYGEVKKKLAL